MPTEPTNFHASPDPDAEFEIDEPIIEEDAVYCCKCRNETFCAAEQSASVISFAYGQTVAYWIGG